MVGTLRVEEPHFFPHRTPIKDKKGENSAKLGTGEEAS